MVNKKATPEKEEKRYAFQFSFRSLFLLSVSFLFILSWVFLLGILVGRGLLPNPIENLFFTKKKTVTNEVEKKNEVPSPIKIDELSFYHQLIDKKEKAKKNAAHTPLLKDQGKKTEKTKKGQTKNDIHRFHVQVAALNDEAKTKKEVERLTSLGYHAYYYRVLINGKVYYRIRCGPFSSIEKAKQYAKKLAKKEGFKPFIVYPQNK